MAIYTFECPGCGKTVDERHPMTAAPELGANAQAVCSAGCGVYPTRIISGGVRFNREAAAARSKYPYHSHQFSGLPLTQNDANGHSIVKSAAHEREIIAASRDTATPLKRDG